MENFYLSALLAQLQPLLLGKSPTGVAISTASPYEILLDFRLPCGRLLKASFEPSIAALYLTPRRRQELNAAHGFASLLEKSLAGLVLTSIYKPPLDRIIQMDFQGLSLSEENRALRFFLALTGRTANAYLTDSNNQIQAMFKNRTAFQIGDTYSFDNSPFDLESLVNSLSNHPTQEEILGRFFKKGNDNLRQTARAIFNPLLEKEFLARCHSLPPKEAFISLFQDLAQNQPQPTIYSSLRLEAIEQRMIQIPPSLHLSHFPLSCMNQLQSSSFITQGNQNIYTYKYGSLSDAACAFYELKRSLEAQNQEMASTRRLLDNALKKLQGGLQAIEKDRLRFAEPEQFKKMGDLLLANITTAHRIGSKAIVVDYYSDTQPLIEIEIGEDKTIQQAAAGYFTHYQKARRALEALAYRETLLRPQLKSLRDLGQQLSEATTIEQVRDIRNHAETILDLQPKSGTRQSKQSKSMISREGRWYHSPSGFDIIVGKNDRDNDTLTFRLARPLDVWLHAADYPGSHVIIRNPRREEVPMKVIQEAAELAAFYSQAKNQSKVAVHYTQKKFVTKPPRAKAGLVRLSSFKTILVEPHLRLEKIAR